MAVNNCSFVGRLVADPEERFTNDGKAISKFRIAVDRTRKNKDGEKQTDFFGVVAFGHSAEFANKYLLKGYLVYVQGELHIDQYTSRDGEQKQWIELAANQVQNLQPRDSSGNQGSGQGGGGGGGQRGAWDEDPDFANRPDDRQPPARGQNAGSVDGRPHGDQRGGQVPGGRPDGGGQRPPAQRPQAQRGGPFDDAGDDPFGG
jgi:single-strand DNA-binding protein